MTAICIEGLIKVYGTVKALDGLNLSVEEGSVFGFLGPNGAGKTTTLRILTRLAHATAGRAVVAGADVTRDGEAVSHLLGYLPEEPVFYNWMTPVEFLDHIGRIFNQPAHARQKHVAELLQKVGLAETKKRRIGGFSRGMRQRLGLAQALMNQPKVLLLDEPVSALDPVGRREVLALINQLRGECTILMSTHILADVERVCDTIAIINHGKTIIQAARNTLLANYATPAFALEVDAGQEKALTAWLQIIANEPWMDTATQHSFGAHILVKDMHKAKTALLPLALNAGLTLTRYELVQPSLEDVFMRLVGEGEK